MDLLKKLFSKELKPTIYKKPHIYAIYSQPEPFSHPTGYVKINGAEPTMAQEVKDVVLANRNDIVKDYVKSLGWKNVKIEDVTMESYYNMQYDRNIREVVYSSGKGSVFRPKFDHTSECL